MGPIMAFRRNIIWTRTLKDPDVLVEPWAMAPRILRIDKAKDTGLIPERGYCEVYKREDIATQIRH
jgi:hypothetical protein